MRAARGAGPATPAGGGAGLAAEGVSILLAEQLPADLADDVTAVAEEMLTNVVRHSYAGTFALSLDAGARVVLEVRDDGVGPNDEPGGGTGIPAMTARAEARGGTYLIEPNEDAFGSRQRWDVPLH